MPALKRLMMRVELPGALKKEQKQIPFGNDRKKSNCEYETTGGPQAFLSVFAFLSVIPEGNLLFGALKRSNPRVVSPFAIGSAYRR